MKTEHQEIVDKSIKEVRDVAKARGIDIDVRCIRPINDKGDDIGGWSLYMRAGGRDVGFFIDDKEFDTFVSEKGKVDDMLHQMLTKLTENDKIQN